MLPVVGHVRAGANGRVLLELGVAQEMPVNVPPRAHEVPHDEQQVVPLAKKSPPSARQVLEEIHRGSRDVHPSKQDLNVRRLQMEFSNIQRGLCLKASAAGEWTDQADQHLAEWLLRPARKRLAQGPVEEPRPEPPVEERVASDDEPRAPLPLPDRPRDAPAPMEEHMDERIAVPDRPVPDPDVSHPPVHPDPCPNAPHQLVHRDPSPSKSSESSYSSSSSSSSESFRSDVPSNLDVSSWPSDWHDSWESGVRLLHDSTRNKNPVQQEIVKNLLKQTYKAKRYWDNAA